MRRYIDADKIDYTMASVYWGKDNKGRDVYRRTFVAFKSDVDELPTADVIEVVRCKDCKHHPENGGECDRSITHTGRDYVCEMNTYRYINLEFCSYGERRAEE